MVEPETFAEPEYVFSLAGSVMEPTYLLPLAFILPICRPACFPVVSLIQNEPPHFEIRAFSPLWVRQFPAISAIAGVDSSIAVNAIDTNDVFNFSPVEVFNYVMVFVCPSLLTQT